MYTNVGLTTNVTIFTDMSHKNGLTGYAYYIRSNYHQLRGSGCFESENNSHKNEMYAIGKALKVMHSKHIGIEIKRVYIYCDNQTCINQLQDYTKTQTLDTKDKDYQQRLIQFLNGFKYALEPRKVKGHTRGKCIRTKVNNWMDEMAREAREKYFKIKFANVK